MSEITDVAISYGGVLLSVISTALAAYHFKGKEALRDQVYQNTQEIGMLKTQTAGDRELLKQQLVSLDAELKDVKRSVRSDTDKIEDAIKSIAQNMTYLVEKQGELTGTLSAVLHRRTTPDDRYS